MDKLYSFFLWDFVLTGYSKLDNPNFPHLDLEQDFDLEFGHLIKNYESRVTQVPGTDATHPVTADNHQSTTDTHQSTSYSKRSKGWNWEVPDVMYPKWTWYALMRPQMYFQICKLFSKAHHRFYTVL